MKSSALRVIAVGVCCLCLALAGGAYGAKPAPGPSAPTGLAAALVFPHDVSLAWNPNPEPDIAGYNVYRNTAPKGSYLKITTSPVAGTSFLDTAVAVGTTYYYEVSAVNAAGVEGRQSAAVAIAVAELPDVSPPGSPSGFSAQPGRGLVTLAWVNPLDNDLSGTTIRYDLSGYPAGPQGGYSVCDRPAAPGTADSFTHGGLVNGRSYYYAAFAYDGSGNYSEGATAVAVPFDNVYPVISGVRADNVTTSGALISWATDEPADSQVEYGTSVAYGSVTPRDAALTTGHFAFLVGLTPATLYHYRVVSADASGNRSVSGDQTFSTAPLAAQACSECHGPLSQYDHFVSDGHGRAGISLACETCHTSGQEHDLAFKQLRTINGFTYTDLSSDLMATVDAQKNYCLYACHATLPWNQHPTGYYMNMQDNTWRYAEILTPEGYVEKYGSYPGTVLPALPELKLLDVDRSGVNSYGDIVMCTTCHEVHGPGTGYFMVPVPPGPDNTASQLCIQCHPY